MFLRVYRPLTPQLRLRRRLAWPRGPQLRPLRFGCRGRGGRARGRIITRHRRGRWRALLHRINWTGVLRRPGQVTAIVRDAARTAPVGLLRRGVVGAYCVLPAALALGAAPAAGVGLLGGQLTPRFLRAWRFGAVVHGVRPGFFSTPCFARAAGCSARIGQKLAGGTLVTLPSGAVRLLGAGWAATAGAVGGFLHRQTAPGGAGSLKYRARRPAVRGTAMNPVDHPHGGKSGPGRSSVSPWGRPSK